MKLEQHPDLMASLLDAMGDGCCYCDLQNPGNAFISERMCALLGYKVDEVVTLGANWQELIHPDDRNLALCCSSLPPDDYDHVLRYLHRDGTTLHLRCRGQVFTDDKGKPLRLLGVHHNITDLLEAQESLRAQQRQLLELKELTVRDDLTGLYNRRGFQDKVEWLLQASKRQDTTFSVLVVDVDDFKTINDDFGHVHGDKVLRAISQAIQVISRDVDVAARYGGDEFVVGLPNSDVANSRQVAERIRRAISRLENLEVSVTIGIATYQPELDLAEGFDAFLELMIKADRAMYAAKHGGKDQVCHSDTLEA